MKIIHLNTFDIQGGAARAANRIHTALLSAGMNSEMLVGIKTRQDVTIRNFPIAYQNRKIKYVKKLLKLQTSMNLTLHSINLFPSGIFKELNRSDADIVHLHWINNELISIAEVAKIKKPIVWTLHDMWAFCGAEHYDDIYSPGRYKQGYYKDNKPFSHTGRFDIDRWTWERKKKHWQKTRFNFVTPSRWLSKCLEESDLFNGQKAEVIPNCLDTELFMPMPQPQIRKELELPPDKKIILFGADGGGKNPNKGWYLLKEAMEKIPYQISQNVLCVVFGGASQQNLFLDQMPVMAVGRINDDRMLAMFYAAADVFVAPSLLEAFGQTASEAMACGTPVVCFGGSGLVDIVDHKNNGYVAQPFFTQDLAQGLLWVLEDANRHARLCEAAREKVVTEYSFSKVADKYKRMYEKL